MQAISSDFLRMQGSSHFVEIGEKKKKTQTQQQQINNTCENVNELPYLTMSAV